MSQPQDGRNLLLSAALQYAHRGWRVFALAPGAKVPRRGSHGCLDATTDPETLERWWNQNPHYNIGIATGPTEARTSSPQTEARTSCPQGLVVFDIDLRNGGDASLYDLERQWGELPDTLTVNTSGGWHLYFAYPGGTLPANFGDDYPGLDIKANGGYVVAPPSIHPDGSAYTWKFGPDDLPLAELPEAWLQALLPSPSRRGDADEGRLAPGHRHTALVSLAGRLVNAGLGTEDQLRAALRCFNEEQCDPPLPPSEVDRLARDAAKWEGRRPATPLRPSRRRRGDEEDDEALPFLPGYITAVELEEMVRNTSWLWPGWIADEYITVVAGENGAGKSWLALALARCVANGLPWPDGSPNEEEPGRVFWLESEGRVSVLRERLSDLGVERRSLCLMRDPYFTYYLDRRREYEAVVDAVTRAQPRLLIVDAWSRSLAGNENDADVRFCLQDLQSLARSLRIPVVLLHHLRKKQVTDWAEGFDFDRLRGSSVLSQVATCVIGVDQAKPGVPHCRVSCGKANLAPLPDPFGFKVEGGFRSGVPASITFGPPPERNEPGSRLEEAKAFLREALANGPRPASEVVAEARDSGISEHTLRRAREETCTHWRQSGNRNLTLWRLKDAEDETLGQPAQLIS